MSNTQRNLGVDLLRAACILYIIGYWHLMPYTTALPGWANLYTGSLKHITLATFVFCSGWLLAGRTVALRPDALWDFYRRRFLRIYPLYLAALGLFWLSDIAPVAQLIDGALLISMFRPPALPTLWFITMIMLFYLVAPALIRAADRPLVWLGLTLGVGAGLAAWHTWGGSIDLRLLLYWPVFALAILYRRATSIAAWLARLTPVFLLALVPALWLASHGGENWLVGIARLWPITLLGTLVLFRYAPLLARRLPAAPVLFVASASYVLYLLHRETFAWLIALWFPTDGWAQAWYLWLVALPLTLVLAWWLQRAYDRCLQPRAAAVPG